MVEATIIIVLSIALIAVFIAYWLGNKYGSYRKEQYWLAELPNYRKEAVLKSRSVIGGQFSEQLAPYLPNFDYLPTECKFIGKPIDFIVFKGMDEKKIEEVVFVEVKTGQSKLSSVEKSLKETIQNKKVLWDEYNLFNER